MHLLHCPKAEQSFKLTHSGLSQVLLNPPNSYNPGCQRKSLPNPLPYAT